MANIAHPAKNVKLDVNWGAKMTPQLAKLALKRQTRFLHTSLVKWIGPEDEWNLYLSVLTLGELEQGIASLKDKKQSEIILKWLNQSLIPRFEHRILPIDEKIAKEWGKMRGKAQKEGTVLPVIDSLIAATAICYAATVVTQNQSDFERCGCSVLNPWRF